MPWGLPNRPRGGERTVIRGPERSSSRKKKDVSNFDVDSLISSTPGDQIQMKNSTLKLL